MRKFSITSKWCQIPILFAPNIDVKARVMKQLILIFTILLLSACSGVGWDHSPTSYKSLIQNIPKSNESIKFKIHGTTETHMQSMTYAAVPILVENKWEYNQLEILQRISKETEFELFSNETSSPKEVRVACFVKNDYRGNYHATLMASVYSSDGVELDTYEAKGFVKSHVASPIAFENAIKLAFHDLVGHLVAPSTKVVLSP